MTFIAVSRYLNIAEIERCVFQMKNLSFSYNTMYPIKKSAFHVTPKTSCQQLMLQRKYITLKQRMIAVLVDMGFTPLSIFSKLIFDSLILCRSY